MQLSLLDQVTFLFLVLLSLWLGWSGLTRAKLEQLMRRARSMLMSLFMLRQLPPGEALT